MKNIKYLLAIAIAASSISAKAAFSVYAVGASEFNSSPQLAGHSGTSTFNYNFEWQSPVGTQANKTGQWTDLPLSVGGPYYSIVATDPTMFTSLALDPASVALLGSGKKFDNEDATHIGFYSLVVNWTLADVPTISVPSIAEFAFTVKFQAPDSTIKTVTQNSDIIAVPEPGQALAGAMILGCGALIFTGRRYMSKVKSTLS